MKRISFSILADVPSVYFVIPQAVSRLDASPLLPPPRHDSWLVDRPPGRLFISLVRFYKTRRTVLFFTFGHENIL